MECIKAQRWLDVLLEVVRKNRRERARLTWNRAVLIANFGIQLLHIVNSVKQTGGLLCADVKGLKR